MHFTFVRQTHSTTRVTTYTCYTFCCHNTGNDHQDFNFSVFKIISNFNEVQTYSLMMMMMMMIR